MPSLKKQDYWIRQSDRQYSFDSQYEIGKELGRGPTSSVCKCTRRGLSQAWAVKILYKNRDKKVTTADVGILLKLENKNLIRLKEIFESKTRIYLIQELVTGGELFDRIVNVGSYTEIQAARAVKDIVSALKYLHSWGIVHRNLKPENLLYENLSENSTLKIADFGLGMILSPEVDMSSVCGSPEYTAPEILKGERFGKPGDMWSLGVIVYILLCGYVPFSSDSPAELFKRILKGQYEFSSPHWDMIGENAKDFIRKLLVVDPKTRMTADAASRNCWVNLYAAKTDSLDYVVNRIKDFNTWRKEKAWLPQLNVATVHPNVDSRMIKFIGTPISNSLKVNEEGANVETASKNSHKVKKKASLKKANEPLSKEVNES